MILVTGTVRLKDGARDEMVAATREMVGATVQEEGCRACRYSFDVSDPDLMHYYEEYESEDALSAHMQSPHLAAFAPAVGELVAEHIEMSKWVGAERASMG